MRLFITGGSRGLGRALTLAACAAGHDVAFTYVADTEAAERTLAEARAAGSGRCFAYPLDVRQPAQVDDVAQVAMDDLGGMDGVIANAGITRDGLAATLSDEAWSAVIDTNLTGAFYTARAFLSTFVGQRSGRILFVSSIARDGISGQVNYAASKAGLVGLAKTLGKEYGARGITSNVVVPGFYETDLTRAALHGQMRDFAVSLCPQKRMGRADEFTSLVLFLLSEAASFINCAVMPVSGGLEWAP